ncbi:hypothetical protein Tco_0586631 [Tanacetum coccineum]
MCHHLSVATGPGTGYRRHHQDLLSTVVNGGSHRGPTTVNTAGPPSTTADQRINHRSTVDYRHHGGSWSGLDRVLGRVSEEHESEDDDQEEEKFVHTPTDDKDDDNLESKRGCSNVRCADAEMNDAQQENENLETTQEQVVKDAHVTISTVTKKTKVPVTSSSCSSDLASKFLNFSDIPHADVEIVSTLDVHVHHEVPRTKAPTLLTSRLSVNLLNHYLYTPTNLHHPQTFHVATQY